MRTRVPPWIITVVLCLASFLFGRLSGSRGAITYSIEGWTTSFNRAWPTYGLHLAEDEEVLVQLRAGNSTHAISQLERMLDIDTYDAARRRSLLQAQELKPLDVELARVAQYREQYPQERGTDTNVFWYGKAKQVDAFLHDYT